MAELDGGELDGGGKALIGQAECQPSRGICDPLLAARQRTARLAELEALLDEDLRLLDQLFGDAPAPAGARATPGGFATPRGARPAALALPVRGGRAP